MVSIKLSLSHYSPQLRGQRTYRPHHAKFIIMGGYKFMGVAITGKSLKLLILIAKKAQLFSIELSLLVDTKNSVGLA